MMVLTTRRTYLFDCIQICIDQSQESRYMISKLYFSLFQENNATETVCSPFLIIIIVLELISGRSVTVEPSVGGIGV